MKRANGKVATKKPASENAAQVSVDEIALRETDKATIRAMNRELQEHKLALADLAMRHARQVGIVAAFEERMVARAREMSVECGVPAGESWNLNLDKMAFEKMVEPVTH